MSPSTADGRRPAVLIARLGLAAGLMVLLGACGVPISAQGQPASTAYLPLVMRTDVERLLGPPPPAGGREAWTSFTSSRRALAVRVEEHLGVVWVGNAKGGLLRWDLATGAYRIYTPAEGLPDSTVSAVVRDRAGSLWLGTWGGLTRIDAAGGWSTFDLGSHQRNMVRGLSLGADGTLWVAGMGGVQQLRVTGDAVDMVAAFTEEDGLPSNTVEGLDHDAEGGVWVATNSGAAMQAPGGTWTAISTADGLASDYVEAVTADPRGDGVWFATSAGASHRNREGRWTTHTGYDGAPPPPPAGDEGSACCGVSAVGVARDGALWLAVEGQLRRRAPGASWRTIPLPEEARYLHAIEVSADGTAWVALAGGGSTGLGLGRHE